MNQLYYECDEPIIDSGDEEAFVFNNKVLEELIRNIYLKEVDVVNDIALAPWHEFWRSFNEATDKGIRLAGFNEDDRGFYRELRYNNGVFAAFRTHRLQNYIARQLLDEKGELKPFERFAFRVDEEGLPVVCDLPSAGSDSEDPCVTVLRDELGGAGARALLMERMVEQLGCSQAAARMRIGRAIRTGKLDLSDDGHEVSIPWE